MVAMTSTLMSLFGSKVMLPGSGVMLNNGMMWFDPRPNQPNSIAGGKRPLTNMSPIILKDGDRPWLAAGASGGRRILAAVSQVMSFIADFGMTPEQAAHQPRIDVSDPDSVSADPRDCRPTVLCRVGQGRTGRADGAWRHADQLRLSERDPAVGGRLGHRHQRRGVTLVVGGRASLRMRRGGRSLQGPPR